MVAGTASGVGKSTVAAALCRALHRRGQRVAPFKAQNMSNHAAVTATGGEIGRAQAQQALAAGVQPTVDMNPILLKPVADTTSHVIVRGAEVGMLRGFDPLDANLRSVVLDSYAQLRADHDIVVLEGAGGAAEINLLDRDLVNLPLAAAAGLPAVLVVDIDRGGAFAALHGTIDLLPPRLRSAIAGTIINRFRGDASLLTDGISAIEARTGVPVLGVLPHLGPEPLLGTEDSLDIHLGAVKTAATPVSTTGTLNVVAVRLPHLANPSDLDPLIGEPGVSLTWTVRPEDIMAADLVIVPGSRATVADLAWLRATGLDQALQATGGQILGLCAGYQMLGRSIHDDVESKEGTVPGLGLLCTTTHFGATKIVRQRHGQASVGGQDSIPVHGYEIRFGRPTGAQQPFLELDGEPEGAVCDAQRIWGTSLHGVLDSDPFRRAFLDHVARAAGKPETPAGLPFGALQEEQHERLADWIEQGLDVSFIEQLAAQAQPVGAFPGW